PKCVCRPSSYATHQTRHSLRRVELQRLTVRPREGTGIGSCIGDYVIEKQTGHTADLAELGADYWQCFTGIIGVVAKRRTAHPVGFVFSTHTNEEGMLSHLARSMKDDYRPSAGGHNLAIGKPDPLALVLGQQLVTDSPVRCLVPAPVGVDLSSDFDGQS